MRYKSIDKVKESFLKKNIYSSNNPDNALAHFGLFAKDSYAYDFYFNSLKTKNVLLHLTN